MSLPTQNERAGSEMSNLSDPKPPARSKNLVNWWCKQIVLGASPLYIAAVRLY
jgi:hypothetical protein